MKKILLIISLCAIFSASFVSCKKTGVCEGPCGKSDVELKKFSLKGKSAWLCSDCYELVNEMLIIKDSIDRYKID